MITFTPGKMNSYSILHSQNVISITLLLAATPLNPAYADHSFGAFSNLSSSNGVDSITPIVATSGNNVYVVWQEGSDIFFANSTDSGATFPDAPINLSNSGAASRPSLAIDGNNVLVAWEDGGDISFIKSTDNGDTFPGPVIDLSASAANSIRPQIAAEGSDVYSIWREGVDGIFFRNSTDGGATFPDAPVDLNNGGGTNDEVQIAVSGNSVYAVWREAFFIFFINSTDNGDSFPFTPEQIGGIVSSKPQIAVSGNNIYIIWIEIQDIKFSRSTDGGATFSAPVDIGNTGPAALPAPQLAVDGNNVYVVWRDDTSGNGDIKFRASTDNGATFTPAVANAAENISNNSGESGSPQVSASGSNVYVVWSDDSSGNFEILGRVSHDNGNSFANIEPVGNTAGISVTPQLASNGNNVYVAWDDDTPDAGTDGDILFSVGAPVAISVQFDKASEYRIGETATLTVTDAASNTDDLVAENIVATIISTEDPIGVTLTLTETGPATGIFSNTVVFSATVSIDEVSIEVAAGDTITASFGGFVGNASIFPISIDLKYKGLSVVAYDFGHIANILVVDQNSNLDPGVAETITVAITSNTDPIGITMDLVETGPNTGIFGDTGSQLIFIENDGDLLPTTGTVTLTHESDPANVDPAVIDMTTLGISSTSDPSPGGITLTITETGADTAVFTGQLTLTPDASVPGTSIKVKGGDILVISVNPNLEKTSLIVPNPNPSVGALTVDFVSNDTATVTYQGLTEMADVNDGGGAGGGGGGIIRPGLVFNLLAGAKLFGGGGSSGPAAPTVSSSTLTFETTPSFTQLEEGAEFTGIINKKDLDKSDTQSIQVGEEIEFSFDLYENGGTGNIQHIALYLNMRGDKFTYADSDTYIIFDTGKPVKIVDPNGYFANAEFTILEKDTFNLTLKYKLVFAKMMENSHILLRVWDFDKRNTDVTHLNAIEVVKGERKITSFEGTDLLKDETSLPSILDETDSLEKSREELRNGEYVPAWIKTSAGWWSEKRISNSDFVMGIEFLIQEKVIKVPSVETTKTTSQKIPDWISTIAGSWADELITDTEFVAALQWLIENGVIKV